MIEWKQLKAMVLGYLIARGLERLSKRKQRDYEIIGIMPRRYK